MIEAFYDFEATALIPQLYHFFLFVDKILNNDDYLTCINCGLEIEQIFCLPDIYKEAHDSDIFISIMLLASELWISKVYPYMDTEPP